MTIQGHRSLQSDQTKRPNNFRLVLCITCDTEITQCETKKICMAKMRCIILVQQKKVQSFEIYNFCPVMRCIILTAPKWRYHSFTEWLKYLIYELNPDPESELLLKYLKSDYHLCFAVINQTNNRNPYQHYRRSEE